MAEKVITAWIAVVNINNACYNNFVTFVCQIEINLLASTLRTSSAAEAHFIATVLMLNWAEVLIFVVLKCLIFYQLLKILR